MPIYVSFLKMTPEGNKEIRKSRERFDLGKRAVEQAGGKVLSAYYVMSRGEYMIVTEFPDEKARVKTIIRSVEHGTVMNETLSILPIEEYLALTEEA